MHLRFYIIVLLLTKSLLVFSQSKSCLDTNSQIQDIRNLYQEIKEAKSSLSVFELFESSGKYNYQLVPNDSAIYLGDNQYDIIYYGDPVLYRYKKDTIKALRHERIFVSIDKSGQINLILSISHDDPEGASNRTTEFYVTNNNELFFSHSKVIYRDFWSGDFTEGFTENKYYYCKYTAIRCLEKKASYPLGTKIDINTIQNEYIDLSKASSNYNDFQNLIRIINEAKRN